MALHTGMKIETEQFYMIIDAIARAGLPVTFKGALVTRQTLEDYGSHLLRETADVDMDWNAEPLTMEEYASILTKALSPLGLNAQPSRMYKGTNVSAGFKLLDEKGELYTTIDMSMRRYSPGKIYNHNGMTFRGTVPEKIIADKILAISGDHPFRRAKDLYDLYALSQHVSYACDEIRKIAKNSDRTIGSFEQVLTKEELLHKA